jgi:acetate kinase
MKVLVLNSGSSSQKSCLFEIGNQLPVEPPACLWEAKIEWQESSARVEFKHGVQVANEEWPKTVSRRESIQRMLENLRASQSGGGDLVNDIDVVGHRVVHGGPSLEDPAVITPEVKSAIAGVSAFAPLHNRAELESIEEIEKLLGGVKQVAVFDTGFHKTMPLRAQVYPGPYAWYSAGIRRYGFHGINHKYCARRAAQMLPGSAQPLRLVTCHLGNGCSLAAIRDGKSVDTTMGFTPLEGLMMGTRSGSVDPGILTYLMREKHLDGKQLDDVLNKQSGLLGISGISGDMREVVAAMKDGNDRAQLAFDIYVHRLRSGIGAMIASLGGIDALVFTAGVGENSSEVRAAACENLRYVGVELDTVKNAQSALDTDISTLSSTTRVLIIRAKEDWEIARSCWEMHQLGVRQHQAPQLDIQDKTIT